MSFSRETAGGGHSPGVLGWGDSWVLVAMAQGTDIGSQAGFPRPVKTQLPRTGSGSGALGPGSGAAGQAGWELQPRRASAGQGCAVWPVSLPTLPDPGAQEHRWPSSGWN